MNAKVQTHRKPDLVALLADLKACSQAQNLRRGKQVHAEAVQCRLDCNIYVANTLINMYAKCCSMVDAQQVFDSIRWPTVVSWTVLILGYADNGEGFIALELFAKTKHTEPSSVSFVAALKACSSLAVRGISSSGDRGKKIHSLVLSNGLDSSIRVQSTMIDMYAKCGCMLHARDVFDRMKHPDVVPWNALILGYADNGQGLAAWDLFTRMKGGIPPPDSVTFMAALKACISLAANEAAECRNRGKEIHNLAAENGFDTDVRVQGTLIKMYAKCGSMSDARRVFDSIQRLDVVCWNALIFGYADNGQGVTALELFTRMKNEGRAPDSVTFSGALKACALVGALELGRRVHRDISRGTDHPNVVLVTCLVDFYSKCGSPVEARYVFDLHEGTRNILTWTALLAGFSSCGDHESALGVFKEMQDAGLQPDSVTFLSVLTCCSHAGLVERGMEFFDSMSTKYAIAPIVEHYNSMVDSFGRCNRLDDAMALLRRMSCCPNDVTWMTVLGACRRSKNVEIAVLAFQSLINSSDREYVLMEQIYGSRGMLREQEMVMGMRRSLKVPRTHSESCWTNEAGEIHTFWFS